MGNQYAETETSDTQVEMTTCGSQKFWDGDRRRPGGQMNLCGGYGVY